MLHQTRRVVVGVMFALVVFAGSAAAECAWVLWSMVRYRDGDDLRKEWDTFSAFTTKKECEERATDWNRYERSRKDGPRASFFYQCFPDTTVDPRGPKGGGR